MTEGYVITEKPDSAERQQIRKIYDGAGITLLMFLVIFYFLAGRISIIVLNLIFTPGTESYVNAAQIINLVVVVLLELGTVFLGSRLTGIKIRSLFKTEGFTGKTLVKTYFTAQGLGFAGSYAGGIIIAIVTVIFGQNMSTFTSGLEQSMAQSDFVMGIILIQGVITAPILEELIFRGIILGALSRYDRTFAIIVSAVMFGATHGNFQQAVYATVMGIVFGAIALRYNSIIPSVIAHTFVNAFAAVSAIIMSSSGYLDVVARALNTNNPLEILQYITPQMIMTVMLVALLNIGIVITAVVIVITNRKRFREFFNKATAAGKARSLPILITSIPWDINFAVAIFMIFVNPFVGLI
ncbi:MAG: CPBP family intramembrane metalloprotease [Ruminococcus sp.]|jgi:membrane protease YdiL (CAAX protease family)|nr:CPBP family intramembrane metalloprotease [Ruminococcus sp.]